MLETLLSPETHPLQHLSLARLRLDASTPVTTIETHGDEALLYNLTGHVNVYVDGACLGTLGGRKSVTDRLVHVMRFPAGTDFTIAVVVNGYAADLLCVSSINTAPTDPSLQHPYLHWNDTTWNEVGQGTHLRHVAEVPTPKGFEIYVGETLNIPGGTSSWPPHADDEDLKQFVAKKTTWEEVMYFCCQEPGIVDLQGIYTGNKVVDELQRVKNGSAHVMPLGSHKITAAPDSYMWYFWAYRGTALQKQYRKFSDDTNIYVK